MNRSYIFIGIWLFLLLFFTNLKGQDTPHHTVYDKIYIGLPHCPDDSSWYISEQDADHVIAVCSHIEEGPAPPDE